MTFFSAKPVYVMGIVNVTPDSFSDGGKFFEHGAAIAHACHLIDEGADILDIGGESTRPGATPLLPAEEQARIIPVITALKNKGVMISVDTRNAVTMRAALDAGAQMINDVSALAHDPAAMALVAGTTGPVCLMHMQGTPETMQRNPVYEDVVEDIFRWLQNRIAACEAAGIARTRIVADPGFGFGKTYEHNIALLDNFARLNDLGVPLLAGLSRKRFIGQMMGGDPAPEARIDASVRAAIRCAGQGAKILRVHDVAPTLHALAQAGMDQAD